MATCTATVAAVGGTGSSDALFNDASLVSALLRAAANTIELQNDPVAASSVTTIAINNIFYTITTTIVNT